MNPYLVAWNFVILLNAFFVINNLGIYLLYQLHKRFIKTPFHAGLFKVHNWVGSIGIGVSSLIVLMPFWIRYIDPAMDWRNVIHTVIFGLVGMAICSDNLLLDKPEKRIYLDRISVIVFMLYTPYLIYYFYTKYFVLQ